MRIACLPVGDITTPSTWYRIGQYLPFFKKNGIHVEIIHKKKIDFNALKKFDLVINQKNLFSRLGWLNFIRQHKVLFDFDDALWTRPIKPYNIFTQWKVNRRLKFWLEHSKHSFVANHYLADHAKQTTENVSVFPMSLDLDVWKPGTREKGLIGWSGAPHNFHYLKKIEGDLLKIKKQFPHVRFAIHSGKKPSLKIPFEYIPFKKGEEALFIQRLDIGLLPLDQDPYSLGKSPIKGLQYMACEVPIVTNGTGATKELLRRNAVQVQTSWVESLSLLLSDPQRAQILSQNGRFIAEEHHDLKKVAESMIQKLRTLKES